MNETNKKINRRAFLKESACKTLPFLGILTASPLIFSSCGDDDPIPEKPDPNPTPSGCYTCSGTAKSTSCSTCSGTAKSSGCGSCSTSCASACKGYTKASGCIGCGTSCNAACSLACLGGCSTSCRGGCTGSAKCAYAHCYGSY